MTLLYMPESGHRWEVSVGIWIMTSSVGLRSSLPETLTNLGRGESSRSLRTEWVREMSISQ